MKPILALVTAALVILVLEEKVRQVAGEAKGAYGELLRRAARLSPSPNRWSGSRLLPCCCRS